MTKLKYSETFYSPQGEGHYTGIPSIWLRFFNCNLNCDGFGQKDPTNPDTYELPYQTIDLTNITDMQDLPVFDRGCDSSYSWSKRFAHLIKEKTAEETVDELTSLLPHNTFIHPKSNQEAHMVFTGGEPMLPRNQRGMIAVLHEFKKRNNLPHFITIETNGTREISDDLEDFINLMYWPVELGGHYNGEQRREWFWSVSPKLFTTSGEKREIAIKPEVVCRYNDISRNGQLKFVVNGSSRTWDELDEVVSMFRDAGCEFPVWIMPEGATEETQRGEHDGRMSAGDIANQAIERGYNVAARVHAYLWGNSLGV